MKKNLREMIKRPIAAFVSSFEMLGERVQALQRIDAMVSRVVHTLSSASGSNRFLKRDAGVGSFPGAGGHWSRTTGEEGREQVTTWSGPGPTPDSPTDLEGEAATSISNCAYRDSSEINYEEEGAFKKDLQDDMLKLVRYKVLFVKRDYEVAFPEKEELVSDSLTGAAYTAWKVGEFMQKLGDTDVPRKWRDKKYPHDPEEGTKIGKLHDNDEKYLRVFYEVLDRYPRQELKYEAQEIRILEQIRDRLGDRQQKSPLVTATPPSPRGVPVTPVLPSSVVTNAPPSPPPGGPTPPKTTRGMSRKNTKGKPKKSQ